MSTAFGSSRVARGMAIKTEYKQQSPSDPKGRPVNIAVLGIPAADASVASTPYPVVSLSDIATKFKRDSTVYQIVEQLIPENRVGVGDIPITIFPLDVGAGAAQAVGSITPSGTASETQVYQVKCNNIISGDITILSGETVADWIDKAVTAMNGVLRMPGTASDDTTKLDFTMGVEGKAGDYGYLEVVSPDNAELTFSVVQPTGGAGTITTSTAYNQWGEEWYSHVINGLGGATEDTYLDDAADKNEQLWAAEEYRPFKHYTGTSLDLTSITAISDLRTTDRTNSFKPNPGSNDLPWVIAARQVAIQAVLAEEDAALDYCLKPCAGLTVGPAASVWSSGNRQSAVTQGCSTVEVRGGQIVISDSIMCYHVDGEDPPPYRYDNDIEKLCYMLYNLKLIFNNPDDAGKPMPPEDADVTNPNARKPSYFQSKCFALFDGAESDAVIADKAYSKLGSTFAISGSNNRRLDATIVYKVLGNANIFSVTNRFSLYLPPAE